MDNHKIQSRNTMNHIVYYDRYIERVEWEDSDLLFYFDAVDVLETHPNNDTGVTMVAENAVVRAENVIVVKSIYYDIKNLISEMREADIKFLNFDEAKCEYKDIIDLCKHFLITEFNITYSKDKYTWRCFGENEFIVECDSLAIYWNDFSRKSWI